MTNLEKAAFNLVEALNSCNEYITGAFMQAYAMKGIDYKGPTYKKELTKLRNELKKRGIQTSE